MIGVWSLNWSISEYSKLLYSKIKLENYWYFLFISLICHMFKYFISLQTYKLLHEVQHLYQYRKIKDKKNHGNEWHHNSLLFISSETQ